jgi:hypothetical protein
LKNAKGSEDIKKCNLRSIESQMLRRESSSERAILNSEPLIATCLLIASWLESSKFDNSVVYHGFCI